MPGLSIGVANALSSRMEVTSHGEGATQRAVFECGRLLSLDRVEELAPQGLRIRCLLDPLIFDAKLDPRHVEEELTQLAWLCPRLEFTFQGRAVPNKEGPLAWVRALAPGFVEETGLTAHQDVGAIHVDVGLGWRSNQSAPNLVSLVNFLRTSGGSHEEGLLTALRQEAERRGIAGERVLAGLTAVVHVGFDYPPLEGERAGPTLESPEAAAAVAQTVTRVLDAAPWWWDRLCEVM
jgi:DNA gyrase/topoisomerase IV subunit B